MKTVKILFVLLAAALLISSLYIYLQEKPQLESECTECTNTTTGYSCNFCGGAHILSDSRALFWMRDNLPHGTTVLSWWDYGKEVESVGKMNPIIKNSSKSILGGVSTIVSGKASSKNYPTDPEEKVADVAIFLTTDNDTEALCVAKKYGATYAYLTFAELGKYHWIERASNKTVGSTRTEKMSVVVDPKTNVTLFINTRGSNYRNGTFVKLFFTDEYDRNAFDLLYDAWGVKIFSINYTSITC